MMKMLFTILVGVLQPPKLNIFTWRNWPWWLFNIFIIISYYTNYHYSLLQPYETYPYMRIIGGKIIQMDSDSLGV
jgi:hypothetical protein